MSFPTGYLLPVTGVFVSRMRICIFYNLFYCQAFLRPGALGQTLRVLNFFHLAVEN